MLDNVNIPSPLLNVKHIIQEPCLSPSSSFSSGYIQCTGRVILRSEAKNPIQLHTLFLCPPVRAYVPSWGPLVFFYSLLTMWIYKACFLFLNVKSCLNRISSIPGNLIRRSNLFLVVNRILSQNTKWKLLVYSNTYCFRCFVYLGFVFRVLWMRIVFITDLFSDWFSQSLGHSLMQIFIDMIVIVFRLWLVWAFTLNFDGVMTRN